jgi:membrane protein YqaA with SNARE-associated domain
MIAYLSLFVSALLAATLLPLSSEVLLATLILSEEYHLMWLWIWATLGNVIGSIINWGLGRYFIRLIAPSRFLFSQREIDQAQHWFLKYGIWTLLLAWLPVIGDPLTLVAGIFRVPILLFTTLVFLGKGIRYFIVIYLVA